MANAKAASQQGYGRSDKRTFTIPAGQNGSNVFRIDLTRPYAFHLIRIEDCSGFAANTNLSVKVANDDTPAQCMCDLKEINEPNITWSKAMPTTGRIQFLLTHAFGTRYMQFITSENTSADVEIDVYGYDPTLINVSGGV